MGSASLTLFLFAVAASLASARVIVASTTIQAAVDASQPGDTVKVPFGIYRENVVVNKNLADSSRIEVSGAFENSDGAETIKVFRLVLDGATLQDAVFSAPAVRLALFGKKYGSGSGNHQLSLTVASNLTY